jgi:hypothetical protein
MPARLPSISVSTGSRALTHSHFIYKLDTVNGLTRHLRWLRPPARRRKKREGGAQITGIQRADLLGKCAHAPARLEFKDGARDLRDRISNTKRELSAKVD